MYPRTDYLDENPVILAESLRAALASERALSERYFTYWQTAVKRIKELEDAKE